MLLGSRWRQRSLNHRPPGIQPTPAPAPLGKNPFAPFKHARLDPHNAGSKGWIHISVYGDDASWSSRPRSPASFGRFLVGRPASWSLK